ncbi:Flp pilus assembly protein CpaB [Nocardioides sp. dk4132]|uniref:Flp pilus assembly protein CpaB n=1 Tax=unclassified Nocardioides TaxID=2615069 RepID=UPI0012952F60|nr:MULTISPECIES: Flp pilus assembly protein CpaB [unclassified Nocardioides]MQW76356.1 Flp pilus assembly protein CpaB [Nocardioides sp. dk4132]QGA07366.1 Flp pilus assembly protein CpaB [Nocardioides sp. dk884]
MNARQRRGVLFLLAALALAIAVFVAVSSYVSQVESQVGPKITVYEVSEPVDAYLPLGASNVRAKEVPRRWASPTAVTSLRELEGRRVGFQLAAGTVITSDMLIPSTDLSPTEREIAINVDSVTGVAGRVRPGDRVDIIAVFADVPGLPKQARVIVRDVRIVSIGGQQTVTVDTESTVGTSKDVVPVTLALEPKNALSVTYAAAFAQEVRLVALPGDVGANRSGEIDDFDAEDLGGQAVPEEAR